MQFHMWPSVVFTDIRLKMRKKYDKKLPSEWVLERKRFRFFDRTFFSEEM